jgi:hypothetical protein
MGTEPQNTLRQPATNQIGNVIGTRIPESETQCFIASRLGAVVYTDAGEAGFRGACALSSLHQRRGKFCFFYFTFKNQAKEDEHEAGNIVSCRFDSGLGLSGATTAFIGTIGKGSRAPPERGPARVVDDAELQCVRQHRL